MELSFIIVSWNARKYLLECLESLVKLLSEYKAEIIVVDNGSTDGSQEMVREQFPAVILIENQKNLGFAKANNIGMLRSKGKYIFLVNSDVIILDGCIDSMINYMNNNSKIGMLGPQILNTDRTIQPSCKYFPTLWRSFCRAVALDSLFSKTPFFQGEFMTCCSYDTIRPVDIIVGCFWMVRRTAMDEVGLLDERFFIYSEDKDWCKRFHAAGWEIIYFPDAKAIHYGGASSENSPIHFYIEMQKSNLQYWEKHYDIISIKLFRIILYINNIFRLTGYLLLKKYNINHKEDMSKKIERSKVFLRWMYTESLKR